LIENCRFQPTQPAFCAPVEGAYVGIMQRSLATDN